jgi:hypothetical protein
LYSSSKDFGFSFDEQVIPSHPIPSHPILSMIMLDGNMITWELTFILTHMIFWRGLVEGWSFVSEWVCGQGWVYPKPIHTYIHTLMTYIHHIHTLVAVCGDWLPLFALWQIILT